MKAKRASAGNREEPQAKGEAYAASTVMRAIDILEAFTLNMPELSLTDISEIVGLHKATTLRLLRTLCLRGLVIRDPTSGRYRLGVRMLSMAEIAKGQPGLALQALPLMRELRDLFSETVFLSVRIGDHRVDIEQVEGLHESRQVKVLGRERPLYAGASSKVLLAHMKDAELEDYFNRVDLVPFTPRTVVDRKELMREILKIRRFGYGESTDETNSGGASASAPIFAPSGDIISVITVTVPRVRFTAALRQKAIVAVKEAAAKISANLGGTRGY